MPYTAAVLTISDKGARGERKDTSGPAICDMLMDAGYEVTYTAILPDDRTMIREELILCADERNCALVVTTGGTGFSPRDITPEATLDVVERLTPGIPEVMRSESMKITPHGCLSRETAGIRGRTLIVNLPGSEKAVRENLAAVLKPLKHGLDMLHSEGSADCGHTGSGSHAGAGSHTGSGSADGQDSYTADTFTADAGAEEAYLADAGGTVSPSVFTVQREVSSSADGSEIVSWHVDIRKEYAPSPDAWLREAKHSPDAAGAGMYLMHNGVVRSTARAAVREGAADTGPVTGMVFSFDADKAAQALRETGQMPGICYVKVWLNAGSLRTGDDIMYVLVGGDIRPHVIDSLQFLVGRLKNDCVTEKEVF